MNSSYFYSLDMSTSDKSIYKLTIFKTYQLAGWLCLYAYVTYIQNLEEHLEDSYTYTYKKKIRNLNLKDKRIG